MAISVKHHEYVEYNTNSPLIQRPHQALCARCWCVAAKHVNNWCLTMPAKFAFYKI